MTWTKNREAQKNLDDFWKEGVITGTSDLKRMPDPRIAAILMHSDQVVNRKKGVMRNANGNKSTYKIESFKKIFGFEELIQEKERKWD